MKIEVYPVADVPSHHRDLLECKMGYELKHYTHVAFGMHDEGHHALEELFGAAHIVSPGVEICEPVGPHYALITVKK